MSEGFLLQSAIREAGVRLAGVAITFIRADDGRPPLTLTLGDIVGRAEVFAARVRELGLGSQDAVVVQVANSIECVEAYAGALLAGVTLVPVPASYGSQETLEIAAYIGARLVVVDSRRRSGRELISRVDAVPGLLAAYLVQVGDHVVSRSGRVWDDFMQSGVASDGPGRAPRGMEVPAGCEVVLFTSGSTGTPKGVMHSGESLISAVRGKTVTSNAALPDRRHLHGFPSGHMGGLLGLLRPFIVGEPMVLLPRWSAEIALSAIHEFDLNTTVGPPTFILSLIELLSGSGVRLPALRDVEVGSASVPAYLIEEADRLGMKCYKSYGCTEHPCAVSGAADDPLELRAGTDGYPIGGNQVAVLGDEDERLTGVVGELVLSGPAQAVGYLGEGAGGAESAVFTPAGLRTGDLGRIRPDGRLEVVDRLKEVIIRGGETLAPGEIEAMLLRLPEVRESAVVGMGDKLLGEIVCAVIVPRGTSRPTLPDIRVGLEQLGISRHKLPERLVITDELPKNAVGKIVRRLVKSKLVDEGAA